MIAAWVVGPAPILDGWVALDSLGLLFLAITSALFLVVSVYGVHYLASETNAPRADFVEGAFFSNGSEHLFTGLLLSFLAAMTLVTLSHHLALLWVAVEATTLTSAPLIYFHRHHRSLEATWKYLIVASVGIALALLGTLFIAVAAESGGDGGVGLMLGDLVDGGTRLDSTWLRAGFVILLVGYGTKMGIAPMHTWLPDAHSESPSLVSALMSGALLNTAFLAILRAYQVLMGADEADFAQSLFVGFGLISMATAAVFIIRQMDYKRMLAYSSIEHMGILMFGIGVGGDAIFGAMFHALNHSLAKGLLFLVAGNVLAVYHTTSTRTVRGVLSALPASGLLWVAGFFAIAGTPPFGTFFSEFIILRSAVDGGFWFESIAYLGLLLLVFIGMATIVFRMAQGAHPEQLGRQQRERILSIAPPAVLAVAALAVGFYVPPSLHQLLTRAAAQLGGG